MAIRPSPGVRGAPCYRASPARPKKRDHADIRVVSHKQTVQHSVRAQKQDERQLSKFFKGLDDLKAKRLLQIDKEMSEQEQILEKLELEIGLTQEQRSTRAAGGTARDASANADISALLPEHLKRGLRPSVRRGSSNFDLYAFMMRRESDHSVTSYNMDGKVTSKPKKTTRKHQQSRQAPPPASSNDDLSKPAVNSARDGMSDATPRATSPAKTVPIRPSSSSASIGSVALSVSLGSLPPSTPVFGLHDEDAGLSPTSLKRNFPRGSDWPDEVGPKNVNKEYSARTRQRTLASKQPQAPRGVERARETKAKALSLKQDHTKYNAKTLPKSRTASQVKVKNTLNPSVGSPRDPKKPKFPVIRLKKEVSFHLDTTEDGDDMEGSGIAIGAGIMQKTNLLQVASSQTSSSPDPTPECTEPDCIFHNKTYRRSSLPTDEDYTIDDYYRKVSGRPTVSPIFMPAGTPRAWSRRGVVRPPSPTLSDFLREFHDTTKPASETSKGSLAESDSFLTVRRPLKGSNRERMLKDKEENVRTTFNLMRQKMADQQPLEFNQNYGTPTPNWKILNPLKMRHKINQSNPLHVRWGL